MTQNTVTLTVGGEGAQIVTICPHPFRVKPFTPTTGHNSLRPSYRPEVGFIPPNRQILEYT